MALDAGPTFPDFFGILLSRTPLRTKRAKDERMDPAFLPHYQKLIKPLVDDFEDKRVLALQKARFRGWLALSCCLISLAIFYHLQISYGGGFFGFVGILLIFGSLTLVYYAYMPVRAFKGNIKEQIYPLIFRYFGNDFSYAHNPSLSAKSLRTSGIIPGFDDEHNEDYIRGIYKGVTLELMESVLTKEVRAERQGKSERHTEEVFRGLFIVFSVNKSFHGQTIVRRDSGRICNWLLDKTSRLETVHLEDPAFEDKFQVMSTDQVEARYLLTTSFMERLLQVEGAFQEGEFLGGGQFQCSFYNDKLLFAIPSLQNRFEIGRINQSMTFVPEINEILMQMRLIFSVIDTLKLDETTGL